MIKSEKNDDKFLIDKIQESKMHFSACNIRFLEKIKKEELIAHLHILKNQKSSILDLQCIRVRSILNMSHLKSAIWHASNAFVNGHNIGKTISVEFLLYVSGQRQIIKAFKYFGLEDNVKECSLIIFHNKKFNQQSQEVTVLKNLLATILPNFTLKSLEFIKTNQDLQHLASNLNISNKYQSFAINKEYIEKVLLSNIANLTFET